MNIWNSNIRGRRAGFNVFVALFAAEVLCGDAWHMSVREEAWLVEQAAHCEGRLGLLRLATTSLNVTPGIRSYAVSYLQNFDQTISKAECMELFERTWLNPRTGYGVDADYSREQVAQLINRIIARKRESSHEQEMPGWPEFLSLWRTFNTVDKGGGGHLKRAVHKGPACEKLVWRISTRRCGFGDLSEETFCVKPD